MLIFNGSGRWGCWKTTTTLKNEHECSFSTVVVLVSLSSVLRRVRVEDAAGECRCPLCWQLQLQLLSSSILPGVPVEPSLSCHVTVSKRRKNRNHGRTFACCPHHPLLCPRHPLPCRGLLPYPRCSLWSWG